MGVVIFNGMSSKEYGILVEHPPEYQIPERDYEVIHIPGRNGDLVIDNGSYQNVSRTYEIAVGNLREDFTDMANRISEWLHSASGYARLEDSYEPEYYRMAMFKDEVSVENILQHAGRATIEFNCKPQRFLKYGDEEVRTTDTACKIVLRNPTGFCSLPKIVVKLKAGMEQYKKRLTVGNADAGTSHTVTFAENTPCYDPIIIDSDMQDVYAMPHDYENFNSYASLSLNGFPKLYPGENVISWDAAISDVEVVPRWWTL